MYHSPTNTDFDWSKVIITMKKTCNSKIAGLPTIFLILLVTLIAVHVSGCKRNPNSAMPSLTPTLKSTSSITPPPPTSVPEGAVLEPTDEPVLSTPTPAPTATPSQLDFVVEDITQRVGIDDLTIFGFSGEDVINFLISVFIVLLGIVLGIAVMKVLLWLARRTPPKFDDQVVMILDRQLKWLILLILLDFATARLVFLSPALKQWLDLIYFSLYVVVIASILWKLIDYGLQGPLLMAASPENRNMLITYTPLIRRSTQSLIFILSLAIILQNFGVNLTALLAVLGLGGLAVSLAAKETLEDMINGFIILIDRPFQVGDRIKIESTDSWGDVEAISSRTTQIRILDNRLIIVPNSIIGKSQIEKFTYPDPSYRLDISLGIAYGSNIDQVIEIIEQAILGVPKIMTSKPPLVDLIEFGDTAMIFRAMYWLETYQDIRLRTEVNKAIYQSLTDANIDMPFITYDINLAYKEPLPDRL